MEVPESFFDEEDEFDEDDEDSEDDFDDDDAAEELFDRVATEYANGVESMADEMASRIRQRLVSRGQALPNNLEETVCGIFAADLANDAKEDALAGQDDDEMAEGELQLGLKVRLHGLKILLDRLQEKLSGNEEAMKATVTQIREDLIELMNEPGLMDELSGNAVRGLARSHRAGSTFHPTPQIPSGH